LGAEDVLLGDGDAGQWIGVAGSQPRVGSLRLCQRQLRVHGDEGIELRIERCDAIEVELRQFDAGDLAGSEGSAQFA